MDLGLISKFTQMAVQFVVIALLGGAAGMMVAAVVDRSRFLSVALISFLRTTLWFPFFVVCALPDWPIRTISLILAAGILAETLFACHESLLVRSTLRVEWFDALPEIGRKIILQAFLFSFYSQIHQQSGWVAESFERPEILYAALIMLCLMLFLLDKLFRTNFDDVAEEDCKMLTSSLQNQKATHVITAILFGSICFSFWYLSSEWLARHLRLGSPLDVLTGAYTIFIAPSPNISMLASGRMWQTSDAFVSLLEILVGLLMAGGLALAVSGRMSQSSYFRAQMLRLLNITYVVPLILALLVSNWVGRAAEVSVTVLAVSLISFYPFIKIIWGLRGRPVVSRVLLGAAEAMPFAFVGMIFGELWGATKGLGFIAVLARAELRINEAMAVSLLIFVLLTIFSSTLRWIAKRLYLSTESH
jgi:ABC-type nitrate/sulfonate/bicarbonate transport system permease component